MMVSKMNLLFQGLVFRFLVKLQGCTVYVSFQGEYFISYELFGFRKLEIMVIYLMCLGFVAVADGSLRIFDPAVPFPLSIFFTEEHWCIHTKTINITAGDQRIGHCLKD